VFFALGVVAFPMMFGCVAVGFGSVLMMFSCFIVLFSSHWVSPASVRGTEEQQRTSAFGSSSERALFPLRTAAHAFRERFRVAQIAVLILADVAYTHIA